MSIKRSVQSYLKYCSLSGLSERTIISYSDTLNQFIKFLSENDYDVENDDINAIDKMTLKTFVLTLQQRYAKSSVVTKYCCLTAFYSWLVDEMEYLDVNLAKAVKLKQGKEEKKQPVARIDDVTKIFNEFEKVPVATRNYRYYRYKLALQILYSCGVRVSELTHLKYSDYNQDNQSFMVLGKGKKERYIYLSNPEILKTFELYTELRDNSSDWLFPTPSGEALGGGIISCAIKRWCKAAGVTTHLTPHSFRRGCATFMIEHDVDISKVKKVLGHSNIQTTMRYVSLCEKTVEDTMKNFNPMNYINKGDDVETKVN